MAQRCWRLPARANTPPFPEVCRIAIREPSVLSRALRLPVTLRRRIKCISHSTRPSSLFCARESPNCPGAIDGAGYLPDVVREILGGPRDKRARPTESHYGVPVLIRLQLEHAIPRVGVVSVERTPTVPDAATAWVLVTVAVGSVIGCDTDQSNVGVFSDTSQPFHVAA